MPRSDERSDRAGPRAQHGPTAPEAADTGAERPAAPLPAVSLPKGGGAIRGIGEKFATHPVTGTGAVTVPIALSPSRSGFGPSLSLSYDSGSGNGPFGFGWSPSIPAITRKTSQGLPRYLDAEESDVFLLSDAEDLVPGAESRVASGADRYTVRRYRPRIEGSFARIERWRRDRDGDVHWRSISRDNVLTLYGLDARSRIADPEDASRVFSWLICESRDDRGNAVLYGYKAEDGEGVELWLPHQRSRGDRSDPRRTANRYLKRIRYGNRTPLLDPSGRRPHLLTEAQREETPFLFEVVLDYGEHHPDTPTPDDAGAWLHRTDAFSSRRAGFEVRTARLCRRVLMFHHFPGEPGVGRDCLVRSTALTYAHERDPSDVRAPIYAFLAQITQRGHRRDGAGYLSRALPPLEFEYTEPVVQQTVRDIDRESIVDLPTGVDGATWQWIDLHGEGIPGVLTEQAGGWYYKRNVSPVSDRPVELAPIEPVALKPNATLTGGRARFMDLAGDGQPDLVVLDGPTPGLYEHDRAEGWEPFRPFTSRLDRDLQDPDTRLVDLDGDGHADVMITEGDAIVWHPALGEAGFGAALRVPVPTDEEHGPRLVFANGADAIYLADMSGDGLADLVRVRNGEVCYWPNLGRGRFGAKITMDRSPRLDRPDQFDHRRIRLADIDGSGTTDLLYLHGDGVRLYFNQSGNGWSAEVPLAVSPRVDNLVDIQVADLLADGTACLVWSSPLPGDAQRQMRFVDLMGGSKPHLLARIRNNLGAETEVRYASSTRFYLEAKRDGRPWSTRLPFPVHVVERVITLDHVSRSRFTTRYAYHHGHFDGHEREFRGFGMVEQLDTEEMAALSAEPTLPAAANLDPASHVPPVLTRTWFHTGAREERDPLLRDATLPPDLAPDEEREAVRALKGSMLRREVYALDGTDKQPHPYVVTEQRFAVRRLAARGSNRHGVFLAHPREAITRRCERICAPDDADPRVHHVLTLEVDDYGNVTREATIGYGRRRPDASLAPWDREQQSRTLVIYTENRLTDPIDDESDHRTPLPAETLARELTGYTPTGDDGRFQPADLVQRIGDQIVPVPAEDIGYEALPVPGQRQRRPIAHHRTLYRPDDLGLSRGDDPLALLPLGTVEPLALAGERYDLAFTPELLDGVFQRSGQPLHPDPAAALEGPGPDRGGYVDLDGDGRLWRPSGRVFLSPAAGTAASERDYARQHFFLPHRSRDPFHAEQTLRYDGYDLLPSEVRDPLGNVVTVGERLADGATDPTAPGHDYRVLQPWRLMDPNRNRTRVAFDALGRVAATAVMGKPEESLGDALAGLRVDLDEPDLDAFHDATDPHALAPDLLGSATTRLVHDPDRFRRTRQAHPDDPERWAPPYVATLARETHASDPPPPGGPRIRIRVSHSDGFGREIQQKVQAEPQETDGTPGPMRWVGSGWTLFNNKGKPVRQYEPFFSPARTHRFEFGVQVGVSPILLYDPLGRVIATLHPDHTWEKVVFDPWHQSTHDANDTAGIDPGSDDDVRGLLQEADGAPRIPTDRYLPTWHALRTDPAHAAALQDRYPETADRQRQATAAAKARAHRDTPTTAHLDALGRPFLTVILDRVACPGHDRDGQEGRYCTRVALDVRGNLRAVRDAVTRARDDQGAEIEDELGRVAARYAYDMLGNRIHQESLDAGSRWALGDVAGNPILAWDSRDHVFRTEYDLLRRPIRHLVGTDPADPSQDLLVERLVYGEQHPLAEQRNLRGRLHLHLDQAGAATTEAHDFKGNPLRTSRRVTRGARYREAVSWHPVDDDPSAIPTDGSAPLDPAALGAALDPLLEPEAHTTHATYDALDRLVTRRTPDDSVTRHTYDEAGLLARVDVMLRGATADGQPVWTPFVTRIRHDARGRRLQIDYGNGARTDHTYDPLTSRLIRLRTRRDATAFPDDCAEPHPSGWPGCRLQDLHYTHDPVGNVTHVHDRAQQAIFFRNQRVEPDAEYTYDATYRLIEARGREHLGQTGTTPDAPRPHAPDDPGRLVASGGTFAPTDGRAMGTYIERYVYDAVGNLESVKHRGSAPDHPGWTRTYAYDEPSRLEPGKQSNRLTKTVAQGQDEPYTAPDRPYDAHGNVPRMPHLREMRWDHRDQLQMTQRQAVRGDGERTWYVYDAAGQRVRKITESASGQILSERRYLGGFEFHLAGDLVRETLHVMDDQQRIALAETRTAGADGGPGRLLRYQLGDPLGSTRIELDDQAQIISCEEYTPYGSSAYQAVRSQTETPRRYRYTGRERDEESGLSYHGARYYAPWLGRWTSPDPAGVVEGLAAYTYAQSRPTRKVDPGGRAASEADLIEVSQSVKDLIQKQGQRLGLGIADIDHVVPEKVLVKRALEAGLTRDQFKNLLEGTPELWANIDQTINRSRQETPYREWLEPKPDASRSVHEVRASITPEDAKKLRKIEEDAFNALDENIKRSGSLEALSPEALAQHSKEKAVTPDRPFSPREQALVDKRSDAAGEWANKKAPPGKGAAANAVGTPSAHSLSAADDLASKKTVSAALEGAEKIGSSAFSKGKRFLGAAGELIAKKGGKVIPIVGTGIGIGLATYELSRGNYAGALVEAVGASEIPILAQVADIGSLAADVVWIGLDVFYFD